MLLALLRRFRRHTTRRAHSRPVRGPWTLLRLEERAVPASTQVAYAVGAGPGGTAQVNVYDPAGALVIAFNAYPGFSGGVNVAVGDVTGDGINDVVTGPGAGGGPHVQVFSGRDLLSGISQPAISKPLVYGTQANPFTGGVYVAVGDLNGDGFDDVITGPGQNGGPHVQAFSGADNLNTTLLSFLAYSPGFTGGVRVGASDFGGDNGGTAGGKGDDEIVTGPGPGGGPHIELWDYDGQVGDPDRFATFVAFTDPQLPNPPDNLQYKGGVFVSGGRLTHNVDDQGFVYSDIVVAADGSPGSGAHVQTWRLDAVLDAPEGGRNVYHYILANQSVSGDVSNVNPNYPIATFFPYTQTGMGVRVAVITTLPVNSTSVDQLLVAPGPNTANDPVKIYDGQTGSEITSREFTPFPGFQGGVFAG